MWRIFLLIASSWYFTGCKHPNNFQDNSSQVAQQVIDISIEETKALLITNNDIVVLDVRSPEELEDGFIEGAINIDYRADDFSEKVNLLNKDLKYLVYCQSSIRSTKAVAKMKELGFVTLYNMEGGYRDWPQ